MKYYLEHFGAGRFEAPFSNPKEAYLNLLKSMVYISNTYVGHEAVFDGLCASKIVDEKGNEYQMEFKKVKPTKGVEHELCNRQSTHGWRSFW